MPTLPAPPSSGGGGHRLVVLRHGRAESFAADDAARHLTERGRAEAADRGRWIAATVGTPSLALVSSAVRTRETWEEVAAGLDGSSEERIEDALYGASPDAVLDLLRELPDAVATVIYVGHNPTAADLAVLLADGGGDAQDFSRLGAGLPTCGVAVYDLPGPWADLDAGTCRLVALDA